MPWNKGIKDVHHSAATEFKKGQMPATWKPIGTLSIRRDKAGTLRRWIKVAEPKTWVEYAKYLWKQSGRKLIKGLCLHHINNDSLDDRIENLILVSRSDHAKLHNRWHTLNHKVAKRLGRRSVGYDISEAYCEMSRQRVERETTRLI